MTSDPLHSDSSVSVLTLKRLHVLLKMIVFKTEVNRLL